jgi:hypothetical protein
VTIRPALALLVLLASAPSAHAQGPHPILESFRIEWERRTDNWRRPGVDGYVYNDSTYRIGNVRLRVEILDGSNAVVGERFAWVFGDVTPGGRAYFTLAPPPAGQNYRITMESYNVIAVGGP